MNYPDSKASAEDVCEACCEDAERESVRRSDAQRENAQQLTAIVDEVRRLWYRMTRGWGAKAELAGLQRQQYWVLAALARGPRRMTQLAECTQTSQASLTGIVDRMEEHGLVERVRSSEDRRVVEVDVTEAGRHVLDTAHALMLEQLSELAEPLTPAERAQLLVLLRKITQHGIA